MTRRISQFRGQCPYTDCLGDFSLNSDGKLREHRVDLGEPLAQRAKCPGSGWIPMRSWPWNRGRNGQD